MIRLSTHYLDTFLLLLALVFVSPIHAESAQQPNENFDFIPTLDLLSLSGQIDSLIRKYHYNPSELEGDGYSLQVDKVEQIALNAESTDDFMNAFNESWQNGPFSHVRMTKAQQTAEEMATFLDGMDVGGNGVQLEFNDDVATLTVNTMMGQDTIEQIFDAYRQLQEQQSNFLIIDLRNNDGGAFAIRPLVGHLVDEPTEGGFFVSQKWFASLDTLPSNEDVVDTAPWEGWSVKAFWQDVQDQGLMRLQYQPLAPHFNGQVFVLVSGQTFSAAEIAASALKSLPNVTLIGERTAGEVLSQSVYDIAPGYQLFLPIADYYSPKNVRIEGNGVPSDIETSSEMAMETALGIINELKASENQR
jgi:carboxyl-terminal processing protease